MSARRWVVLGVFFGVWVAMMVRDLPASADKVDDLARQLRGDPDYKVRLSAALNLGKLADRRGVLPLIDGLQDTDKTVRGVSAAALGRLVDTSVAPEVVERTVAMLERTAGGDADATVRAEAARSLDSVRLARAALRPTPPVGARGVYVEVGPMSDNTKKAPAVPAMMHKVVLQGLTKRAPAFLLRWPSGASPTELDLKKSATTAYYVEGSLTALNVSRAPPHVSCTVSLILATYPQKSMFGFMKGGADVDAATGSESALAEATSDCVGAVLDDLVGSKLVPTIQARAH